jgi:hypothetical protein
MTEQEHLDAIRRKRAAVNRAHTALASKEKELADEIRAAFADGLKTGPISHAAEWSDTYVRSIRDGKVQLRTTSHLDTGTDRRLTRGHRPCRFRSQTSDGADVRLSPWLRLPARH